jgi:hypothetical protein
VDERGGLQGVVAPLVAQEAAGQLPQFVVHDAHQLLQGVGIAAVPTIQQFRHVAHIFHPILAQRLGEPRTAAARRPGDAARDLSTSLAFD